MKALFHSLIKSHLSVSLSLSPIARHNEHHIESRPSPPKLPPSQRHSLKLSQLHAIDMSGGVDSDSNSHCALLLHDNSAGGEVKYPSHGEASNMIGFIRGSSGNARSFSSGNTRASRSMNSRASSYELTDLRKTHMWLRRVFAAWLHDGEKFKFPFNLRDHEKAGPSSGKIGREYMGVSTEE